MLILNEGDCLQFAGMDHVHILTSPIEICNINKITYSVFPKKDKYSYIYI